MSEKTFITDTFLLGNKFAERLYFEYAEKLPIIDYHNHLPPKEIAENRVYENISQLWIAGDHYKWRAMRTLGIDEKCITGEASDKQKFVAWAKTVPYTVRNPLYHWTHLELKRYFGFDGLLSEKNASEVYDQLQKQLQLPENSCRGLLEKMNVRQLCTTEDPTDDLAHHQTIAKSAFKIGVGTAFRPDKAILIENDDYNGYLDSLAKSAGISILNYDDLLSALENRLDYFDANGCVLSDLGLNQLPFSLASEVKIKAIFAKRRNGEMVSASEAEKFKTAILLFLCEQYSDRNWTQQFHLGALRNNNSRLFKTLGADTGFDSIGDFRQAENLSNFLSALDSNNKLTRTIIYNLNPADNAIFASMIGNFNDGSAKGKMQFGSGWWFLDQKQGIIDQLNSLSNMGLLSCFIGMLTDSRSFVSFPRHEYFRRILCNLIGQEIASGELPDDIEWLGKIVSDICYHNANDYFQFQR
ncbi:glucuronate isomerase [Flavobacterium sp.]|uniref:glucuronate isomerase n=1 Tax=Flavobacterium sp. TaxID=239 RepID=UPI001210A594|nr:glucuronate isomerase [Flavobacterium sp.]RZJ73831.1 MAG: glucuronate isomerase [Flavobacterium sp.]